MVRRVAAVVWEGRSDVAVEGGYGGLVGLTPVVGTSSHYGQMSTRLAAALSPPPAPPSRASRFAWVGALMGIAGCIAGVVAVGNSPHTEADYASQSSAWMGLAVIETTIVAGIVFLSIMLARKLRDDRQWRRAMPEMALVWRTARYCARCALVFFPRSEIPEDLPDRVGPGEFRGLVWQAGMIRQDLAESPAS